MTNSEVWDWIRFACDCNGCPEVAGRIKLVWSNRMTSSMGIASKKPFNDYYELKLSVKLFARASEEEKRQTIIHEACHIIDGIINRVKMSHGAGWAACMRRADCKPEVYHSVSNAGLNRRFVYTCACGQVYKLSSRMHNSINRGRYRVCRSCRGRLQYTGRNGYNV